jgi:hypothetical protein
MGSAGVRQLTVLGELFKKAIDHCRPESIAVLGVAGGNGLEQIECAVTTRIVGVDINRRYLDEIQRRFGTLSGLELHCRDLAEPELNLDPVMLVHAALIFEHVGLRLALNNALSLVAPGGHVFRRAAIAERGRRGCCYHELHIDAESETEFRVYRHRRVSTLAGAEGIPGS